MADRIIGPDWPARPPAVPASLEQREEEVYWLEIPGQRARRERERLRLVHALDMTGHPFGLWLNKLRTV